MDAQTRARFGESLAKRREETANWLRIRPPEARERVSAGELVDAESIEQDTVIAEIDRALARVEDGTFGVCEHGDGDVEDERLELDFTTCVCLAHYSEAQIRALERDLEMAARVQQQLFPQWVPALPGVEIASRATAGRIVSGDYFDFFQFRNQDQGAIIADVMGAGLPAGMLMSNLQASLRIVGQEYDAPHRLAERLNELFRFNLRLIRFITMVLLAVDPEGRRIRFTNAGHNPPLLWQASKRRHRWLKPTGPAIGLMPNPGFATETIDTNPGDVLVLYTDGLTEAHTGDGVPFGEDGLVRFVAENQDFSADELVGRIWNALRRHANGRVTDDVAVLVVRFK